jgi:aminoglycoside 2'-N-acetyltransferase I
VTALRLARSAELSPDDWRALTDLCRAAFDEPWDGVWESIGPGLHVMAEDETGALLAHAAIVDRALYVAEDTLQAGYVEAVAVLPERQGSGLGTLVMTEIDRLLDEAYQIGALSTGRHGFYGRLGWVRWRGPTWIRHPDGRRERTAGEDDGIMVRATPSTPAPLDLERAIAVDWRPGDVW